MSGGTRSSAALIAAALVAAAAPLPRGFVERYYSHGVYPYLQHALTAASNLVPFALFDVLLGIVLGWWTWAAARDVGAARRTRAWLPAAGSIGLRTVTLAACAYLAFLGAWGLNYRRLPLSDKLAYDAQKVTEAAARALAERAVGEVNALYEASRLLLWDERAAAHAPLVDAFAQAQRALGAARAARPARPKRTLLEPYFQAAGVDGMTDPFFLETLLPSDLLPFELPFVLAHEWSHLAGYGDEGEANFVGWLTCMHGDAAARYSGWLFLYRETASRLAPQARGEVAAALGDGPRDDLRAIAERLRRGIRPAVSAAGWRAYDRYLKANRVEAGAASYAEVVRLVLGARFSREWVPQRRQ